MISLSLLYESILGEDLEQIKKQLGFSDEVAGRLEYWSEKHALTLAYAFSLLLKSLHKKNSQADREDLEEFNDFARSLAKRLDDPTLGKDTKQAMRSAKTWIEMIDAVEAVKEKHREKTSGTTMFDLGSGWRWARLESDEHGFEGEQMQHCASDHRGVLVSLRDPSNKPHVTMTWDDTSKVVWQIKGKQNGAPDRKYWPHIQKFFEKFEAELGDEELRSGARGLYDLLSFGGDVDPEWDNLRDNQKKLFRSKMLELSSKHPNDPKWVRLTNVSKWEFSETMGTEPYAELRSDVRSDEIPAGFPRAYQFNNRSMVAAPKGDWLKVA